MRQQSSMLKIRFFIFFVPPIRCFFKFSPVRFRAEGVAVRLVRFGKLQFCLLHITAFSKRKDPGQDLKARLLRSSIYFSIIQKDINRNKSTNTFRIAPKKQSSHIRLLQSLPYELLGCTRFAKPRQKNRTACVFLLFYKYIISFCKGKCK